MRSVLTALLILGIGTGCQLLKRPAASLPFDVVRVQGGSFMMGDVFNHEDEDATPVHEVTIAPFEISTFEITYDQYDTFAFDNNIDLPDDNGHGRGLRAVANVSWYNAVSFCNYYGFRLPSEAEWEYAARGGGLMTRFPGTDDKEAVDQYIRHIDNSVMHSFLVGSKAPNQLGLYDMGGNVYEWIGEYYEFYPQVGTEPILKDLDTFSMRIIRGGSFKMEVSVAQTFRRSGTLAEVTSDTIGFRCARAIE